MKFAISYESKMDYEEDFSGPLSVEIIANSYYEAEQKFARIFHSCFGRNAEFGILGVACEAE